MTFWDELTAPFEPNEIEWRVGSVTKDKKKGMALAYMDARAVMNRLDAVCGPDGWQSRYPIISEGKTVCEIGLRVMIEQETVTGEAPLYKGEWLWKADGAGDSNIEGEKGALSDSFKRAAVRWGIGRYLYNLDSPWVNLGDFKRIQKSEYKILNRLLLGGSAIKDMKPPTVAELRERDGKVRADIADCNNVEQLDHIFDKAKDLIIDIKAQKPMWWNGDDASGIVGLSDEFDNKREELAVARSGGDLINAG